MRQQGEASVEEILESIKKVIARDNRATAIETRRRREEDGLNAPEPVSGLESDEDAEEVLDLGVADFVEEAPAENEFHEAVSEDEEDSPLTTDAVRISLRENLAALAMLAEPGAPPQIVRSGETSLEGLVREMLRPMLAEWLDRNLPGMVEKMVKAEIARIAGKRG
jgi:cell pole-organizing protein PopZ